MPLVMTYTRALVNCDEVSTAKRLGITACEHEADVVKMLWYRKSRVLWKKR